MSGFKKQAVRFGSVGILNTLTDFGAFNLLIALFDAREGLPLLLCNSAAFLAASVNSYLLNKKWTFGDRNQVSVRQYLLFMTFSLGGLALNNLTVYLLTAMVPPGGLLHPTLWVNLAKAGATGTTILWNFFCYRQFVFRKGG